MWQHEDTSNTKKAWHIEGMGCHTNRIYLHTLKVW